MSNMGLSNRWTIHIEFVCWPFPVIGGNLGRHSKFFFGSREMTSQIETCFQTTISCNIVQQGGAKHKGRSNLWPEFDRFLFGEQSGLFSRTLSFVFHLGSDQISFRKPKSTLVPIDIKGVTVQVEILKIEWFKTCLQTKTPTTSKMLPHLLKTRFPVDQRL